MNGKNRLLRLFLAAAVLAGSLAAARPGLAMPGAQAPDPVEQARELMARMTPEERVGQIFLVTFQGSQATADSAIVDLISRQHIGGVVLSAANDNFTNPEDLPSELYGLISGLQTAEWESAAGSTQEQGENDLPVQYVPLLVSISQDGGGSPYNQILNGLTPLPSAMALGATWDPALSEDVGRALGEELSQLGINLIFGPSLDVQEPRFEASDSSLETTIFGGDPFWVQEMGQAYIRGLHRGSAGRMAVIAKHFPGLGSADRNPLQEAATVRKSLEQLSQFELAPFLGVTGSAPDPQAAADGLLVSHIRYLFQGSIRATTRPVSLDTTALSELMALPALQTWKTSGGLLVSDDLGSRAVRRFYDPAEIVFDARQVAREAFLAGNDMLYFSSFTSTGDEDSVSSLLKVLDFFTRKYVEDSAFAQRVDESVLKILTLKFKLYPEFTLEQVLPDPDGVADLGQDPANRSAAFNVARRAVTLISPNLADLPTPPDVRDRLLFLTDTQASRQCSFCAEQSDLQVDALQSAVLRLYGPQAGGQVMQSRMSSYSFADLLSLLNNSGAATAAEPPPLEADFSRATWIVFSLLNERSDRPASAALSRLLNERPDLIRDKRVVVFAFNAPYYLDSTDISKLTAYYGMYSQTPAFLETAARTLFQELTPVGASPVSIPGAGYDLIEVTSPNPSQIIPLDLDLTGPVMPMEPGVSPTATSTGTPVVPEPPTFRIGDIIPLRAGPVLDTNGRPVPDGTLVQFIFTMDGGLAGTSQLESLTEGGDGVARVSYRIDREGLLQINAVSGEATTSFSLRLDVSAQEGAEVVAITPTPNPTITPTPTLTPTATATPEPTPEPPAAGPVDMLDWFLAVVLAGLAAASAIYAGTRFATMRWGMRWGLCAALGALAAYSYLALSLPGSQGWIETLGRGGVVFTTLVGAAAGLLAGLFWRSQAEQKLPWN